MTSSCCKAIKTSVYVDFAKRLKNIIPVDFDKKTTSKNFSTILKEYNLRVFL